MKTKATVKLTFNGVELPMIKDGFFLAADPMLNQVAVRIKVESPTGIFDPHNEFKRNSVAIFVKDYGASSASVYVFRLQKGPPKGWEWIFHNGTIRARRTV